MQSEPLEYMGFYVPRSMKEQVKNEARKEDIPVSIYLRHCVKKNLPKNTAKCSSGGERKYEKRRE